MKRQYLNEAHKKYSEACQKEVEEMAEQPLTHEEFLAQIEDQNRESILHSQNPAVSGYRRIISSLLSIWKPS